MGTAAADDRLSVFDVSTPVLTDTAGDSGTAPDLLIHPDHATSRTTPGTAADDQILFTSCSRTAAWGRASPPGDRVIWYLDTDNDAGTGGPGAVPP